MNAWCLEQARSGPSAEQRLIVSRGPLHSLPHRGQYELQDGWRIVQPHPHWNNMNRLQRFKMRIKIDRVFFRGDECRRAMLLAQSQKLADILNRVPMMIAKAAGAGQRNSPRPQLANKVLRTSDAAKCQTWFLGLRSADVAGHSPPLLRPEP